MVHWTGGRTKEIRGWRKIDRDSVREKGMMIRDNLGNWGRKREKIKKERLISTVNF